MFGGSWKNCYFESHEKSMDKTYLTKQEGKRFSPMVEMTIRSCSEGHEFRTSRRVHARSLINNGFKRKARIPMALAFSEVIL